MWKFLLFGGLVGFLNGCLGGGGGAILVPFFCKFAGLKGKEALASSVAVMLPICLCSVIIYGFQGNIQVKTALPYVLGGGIGGILGGKCLARVEQRWLKLAFAGFLLYSGGRCLFWS